MWYNEYVQATIATSNIMNFFKSEYNDELNKQESLKRITSPHFAYTDLDVEVYVDDLVMSANDPRADGIDPNHVDSLYYKISVDGVDDDSTVHPQLLIKMI